jgi:hypothetical protein
VASAGIYSNVNSGANLYIVDIIKMRNREKTGHQKMEEWNNSQGTSAASTTSEDSFREEEFEKYQKRLTREAEKRKEKESCEQVVKELSQLKISITTQGKQLEGLRLMVGKRDHEAAVWRVEQLSKELTLTRQRDQAKRKLQNPTINQAVIQPGLLRVQSCFGCGELGHVLKYCRQKERSSRFKQKPVLFQFGPGNARVV